MVRQYKGIDLAACSTAPTHHLFILKYQDRRPCGSPKSVCKICIEISGETSELERRYIQIAMLV